jgi:hypothetical protein
MNVRVQYMPRIPAVNRSIDITTEAVRLKLGSVEIDSQLSVSIAFLPKPRLLLQAEVAAGVPVDINSTVAVEFLQSSRELDCEILEAKLFSNEPQLIILRTSEDLGWGDGGVPVTVLAFTIPNFPDFFATGQPGGYRREEVIRLAHDEWCITIYSTSDVRERKKRLRLEGGYAITATGEISRVDGGLFTLAEVEHQLSALRLLLSFACGRWTAPLLPTGLDLNRVPVWQRWRVPLIDSGISVFTWFGRDHAECLSSVFSGLVDKSADLTWKTPISHAIYWFVRANSNAAGADGSLILSHAALENLSWTYLVESTRTLSRSKFKMRPAADKIRLLLSSSGIPTAVPKSLPELATSVQARGWVDGPR